MAESKVFKGILWASFQRFGNLAVSFVSTMVMAALLTPADFGTIGMLMFFLALAQTFVDSGLGAALIQKKAVTDTDTSTVFYANMLLSAAVYVALFFAAPYVADFYSCPEVCPLLRVMGLTMFIQGVTLIQSTLLQKEMNFKALSICNVSGTVVLALSGIAAALAGCGVWSFVIRALAGAAVTSVLLWSVSRWRPRRVFSFDSFRQLFGFGGFMLLSSLCLSVSNNIQSLIIGRLFTPATLGNFTQARTLRNIPADTVQQVIQQVLYPEFSKHQDDNAAIIAKLNQSVYLLSYVVIPMMLLCILLAKPLIILFFGSKWLAAVPYFRILCVGGIPFCIQDVNINVIKAKGHSRLLFRLNLVTVVIYTALIVVGSRLWGMDGLLWVMVLNSTVAYLCYSVIGTRCVGSDILRQLASIAKCLALSAVPLVAATAVAMILAPVTEGRLGALLVALAATACFSVLYIALSRVFRSEALNLLLRNAKALKSKK